MPLLTRAPAPPTWQQVLVSPDERLLWAILAVATLALLAGLALRWRAATARNPDLARPDTLG